MADAPTMYPVFCFRDARAGIDQLKTAFGFESVVEYAGEDGVVNHAELRLGDGFVMVSGHREPDPANPWSTTAIGTYAWMEDVDAHYERAKAAGVDVVMEIRDTEYGSREYSARDREGNLWSFGNYKPQM